MTDRHSPRTAAAAGRIAAAIAMAILVLAGFAIERGRHGDDAAATVGVVDGGTSGPRGERAPVPVRIVSPPSAGAAGPIAAPTAAGAKSYGEPPMADDPILDGVIATAPEEIGVRHRLFAMQWLGSRASDAERAWQNRWASLSPDQAGHVRVRCSSTTCEIATDRADVATRLARLVEAPGVGRGDPCPLATPGGAPLVWSRGAVGVAYIGRAPC